jgi:two-component system response regulator FixJ
MVPLPGREGRGRCALRDTDTGSSYVDYDLSRGQQLHSEMVPEDPTVFVVDDDAETRDVLCRLAASAGLATETYADAQTFLKHFEPGRVGCLVLDVQLYDMTGLQVQRELAARKIRIPVIVTTGYADLRVAIDAMRAGAFDVLEKPFAGERVVDSIRQAVAEHLRTLKSQSESQEVCRRYARLTPRERQVLELVVAGMTSKRIAAELGLQEKTIEVYRSRIKGTMEARNAADLVRLMTRISRDS